MVESLQTRRKRLRFRSWHRGTREAALMLGRFADRYLEEFSAEQLDLYESLIEHSDPDLYGWLSGRDPVPEHLQNPVMDLLIQVSTNQPKY